MNYCYVCGKVLSECPSSEECKCHDEHIIPNAIGGHLTSRDFLCESCGGGLSKGDKVFTDIFAPFIVFLNQAGLLRSLDRDNVDKRYCLEVYLKITNFHQRQFIRLGIRKGKLLLANLFTE